MIVLLALFLGIGAITAILMAGIDMYSKRYIESKMKVDSKNELLQRKYGWCVIAYHSIMALGGCLMLITLMGLLIRYMKYVYSLT